MATIVKCHQIRIGAANARGPEMANETVAVGIFLTLQTSKYENF
jgi:hypothetical protein